MSVWNGSRPVGGARSSPAASARTRGGDDRHEADARADELGVERIDHPAPFADLPHGEIHHKIRYMLLIN